MTRRTLADRCFWFVLGLSVVILFSPKTPGAAELNGIDKVIHALLFAMLSGSARVRFRAGLGWVLAYGAVSEVLQAVLPIHRDGSVGDVLADSVGALLGWWGAGWGLRAGAAKPPGASDPA